MEFHLIRSYAHLEAKSALKEVQSARIQAKKLLTVEILLAPPKSVASTPPSSEERRYSVEVGDAKLLAVVQNVELSGHGLRVRTNWIDTHGFARGLEPEFTLTVKKSEGESVKSYKHTIETRVFGRLVLRETHISTRPWGFVAASDSKKNWANTFVKHWSQDVTLESKHSGISVSRPGSTAKWYYTGAESISDERLKIRSLVSRVDHTYLSSGVLRQLLGDNFQLGKEPVKPIKDFYLDIVVDSSLNEFVAGAITRLRDNLSIFKNIASLYTKEENLEMWRHVLDQGVPYAKWVRETFLTPMEENIRLLEESRSGLTGRELSLSNRENPETRKEQGLYNKWACVDRFKLLHTIITALCEYPDKPLGLVEFDTFIQQAEAYFKLPDTTWKQVLSPEVRSKIKAGLAFYLNRIVDENKGLTYDGFRFRTSPKICPGLMARMGLVRDTARGSDTAAWFTSLFKFYGFGSRERVCQHDQNSLKYKGKLLGYGRVAEITNCFDVGNGLYLLLTYRGLLLTTAGQDGDGVMTDNILQTIPGQFDAHSGVRGVDLPSTISGKILKPSEMRFLAVSLQKPAPDQLKIRCIIGPAVPNFWSNGSILDLGTHLVVSKSGDFSLPDSDCIGISKLSGTPDSKTALLNPRNQNTSIITENYSTKYGDTKWFTSGNIFAILASSLSASTYASPNSSFDIRFAQRRHILVQVTYSPPNQPKQQQQPANEPQRVQQAQEQQPARGSKWVVPLKLHLKHDLMLTLAADVCVPLPTATSTQFIPASKGQYILILSFHKDLSYTLQAFDTTRASFTKVVEHRKVGRGLTEMGYQLSNSVASVDHKKKRWTLTLIAKGFDDLKYAVGRVTVPLLQLSLKL